MAQRLELPHILCGEMDCPRGGGGCDEQSYYLEQHDGWGNHALDLGETAQFGAQKEFLRRRQAFYVRAIMEFTPPEIWARLRAKHEDVSNTALGLSHQRTNQPQKCLSCPASWQFIAVQLTLHCCCCIQLLNDVPTVGRRIDWDSLGEATFPLFGAKKREEEAGGGAERAAEQRIAEHWATVRLEADEARRRESWQRRRQRYCIPGVAILLVAIVLGTGILLAVAPPLPAVHIANISDPLRKPKPEPEPAPEPSWANGSVPLAPSSGQECTGEWPATHFCTYNCVLCTTGHHDSFYILYCIVCSHSGFTSQVSL